MIKKWKKEKWCRSHFSPFFAFLHSGCWQRQPICISSEKKRHALGALLCPQSWGLEIAWAQCGWIVCNVSVYVFSLFLFVCLFFQSSCLEVFSLYRLWKPVCQNTFSPTSKNYQAISGGGLKCNSPYNTTNMSQPGCSSNWKLNLNSHFCHSTIWCYSKTEVMEATEQLSRIHAATSRAVWWDRAYRHTDKDNFMVPGHTND